MLCAWGAGLPRLAAFPAMRWLLRTTGVDAPLGGNVYHSLLGVSSTELPRDGTLSVVRRVLVATRVAALLAPKKDNHSHLRMWNKTSTSYLPPLRRVLINIIAYWFNAP